MDWKDKEKLISWVLTIFGFIVFWPLGLVGLFRILTNGSLFNKRRRITGVERGQVMDVPYVEVEEEPESAQTREPVQNQKRERRYAPTNGKTGTRPDTRNRELVPIKKNWGRGLRFWGILLAVLGGLTLMTMLVDMDMRGISIFDLFRELAMECSLLAGGLTMLGVGISRRKRAARYRRYLSLIGNRDDLSIDALAEAMPVSYEKACADLQNMIEAGHLPSAGRLDQRTRRLMLSAVLEDAQAPSGVKAEPVKSKDTEDAVLREIKELNDRIEDETMSRKIDRIGEITARILDYQRGNPDSVGELRSFLDYYLPTTLKLLRAYAQMEEQGVEGKNIGEVKASVETAMDKVVDGFEKQLDKLFRTDALDITSDIQVLEQMLQKDGLAADGLVH